ncbi:MAG: hypothetical protein QW728_01055, partial [Thermoplasmata archaeon]
MKSSYKEMRGHGEFYQIFSISILLFTLCMLFTPSISAQIDPIEEDYPLFSTGPVNYEITIDPSKFAVIAINNVSFQLYDNPSYANQPVLTAEGSDYKLLVMHRPSLTTYWGKAAASSSTKYVVEYENTMVTEVNVPTGDEPIEGTFEKYDDDSPELIDVYQAEFSTLYTYKISLDLPPGAYYSLYLFGGSVNTGGYANYTRERGSYLVECARKYSGISQNIIFSPRFNDTYCIVVLCEKTNTVFSAPYYLHIDPYFPTDDATRIYKMESIRDAPTGPDVPQPYATDGTFTFYVEPGIPLFLSQKGASLSAWDNPERGAAPVFVSSGTQGTIVFSSDVERYLFFKQTSSTATFTLEIESSTEEQAMNDPDKPPVDLTDIIDSNIYTGTINKGEIADCYYFSLSSDTAYNISVATSPGTSLQAYLFKLKSGSFLQTTKTTDYIALAGSTTSGAIQSIAVQPQSDGDYGLVVMNNALTADYAQQYEISVSSGLFNPDDPYLMMSFSCTSNAGSPLVTDGKFQVQPLRGYNVVGARSPTTSLKIERYDSSSYNTNNVEISSSTTGKGTFMALHPSYGNSYLKINLSAGNLFAYEFEGEDAIYGYRDLPLNSNRIEEIEQDEVFDSYFFVPNKGNRYNISLTPASSSKFYLYVLDSTYNTPAESKARGWASEQTAAGAIQWVNMVALSSDPLCVVVLGFEGTGSYTLRCDNLGADTIPPVITVSAPTENKIFTLSDMPFSATGTAIDNAEIVPTSMVWSLDPLNSTSYPCTITSRVVNSNYSVTYSWSALINIEHNGTQYIYFQVTDISGNTVTFARKIKVGQ